MTWVCFVFTERISDVSTAATLTRAHYWSQSSNPIVPLQISPFLSSEHYPLSNLVSCFVYADVCVSIQYECIFKYVWKAETDRDSESVKV